VRAAESLHKDKLLQGTPDEIFTRLSENTILKGGVVFGACLDENGELMHDYVESIDGLARFHGTPKIQSRIEQAYWDAAIFLKQGRKVLFYGTPCHIAGLKQYLHREYVNLLTVDFVCHGMQSPKTLRNKKKEHASKSCFRPACRNCPFRSGESWSDITLDDTCFTAYSSPHLSLKE
jgi:hypothetical protein